MSCPDWIALRELRDREPEAWDRALVHLDGCPRCRDRALEAEPTLLFRQLPKPALGGDEVEAMKRAVAHLRRTEPIQHPTRRSFAGVRAAALGALLLAASLLRGGTATIVEPGATPDPTAVAESIPAAPPATRGAGAAMVPAPDLEQMPLVESLDPASGSFIQVIDDEISLVVMLPPLDV